MNRKIGFLAGVCEYNVEHVQELVKTSNDKENFNFVWRKKKTKGMMILVNHETKR